MKSRGRLDFWGENAAALLKASRDIAAGSKANALIRLLKSTMEQVIVFVKFLDTLRLLDTTLRMNGITPALFHGSLTPAEKDRAVETFRQGRHRVILCTESGGEGRNLQFCHIMVNFDLPWNPMQIEQRIGRIHRIGQKETVTIYNFCAEGSLEDYILEILNKKINMFELVVGEVDMILGRLRGEKEFADKVFDIWSESQDEKERKKQFDAFGRRLKRARTVYDTNKELDEKLFREDFEL
jgi:SNF2 family DNA or RNA helicase